MGQSLDSGLCVDWDWVSLLMSTHIVVKLLLTIDIYSKKGGSVLLNWSTCSIDLSPLENVENCWAAEILEKNGETYHLKTYSD